MTGVRMLGLERRTAEVSAQEVGAVVEERGVALHYNGVSFAVLMATPTDLEDLALGFSLSEGIVDQASACALVDCVDGDEGIALHLAIPQSAFDRLESRRRAMLMPGSCGLCGLESLQQALRRPPRLDDSRTIEAREIAELMSGMQAAQAIGLETGGAHAAACVIGVDILVREDAGRHNALDKLIGALARANHSTPRCIAVSARASFELVHKCATAKVPILTAISAPTTAAIELANAVNLSLLAFVRDGSFNVYSHPQRILLAISQAGTGSPL